MALCSGETKTYGVALTASHHSDTRCVPITPRTAQILNIAMKKLAMGTPKLEIRLLKLS